MNEPLDPPLEAAPACLTVALCTGGDAERLATCIAALLALRCEPQRWELVVIDFAADEEASRVVHALAPSGGTPRLHYVAAEPGVGNRAEAARRAAAGVVHAGRVVVIGDDTRPEPEWLLQQTALAPAAAPKARAAPAH